MRFQDNRIILILLSQISYRDVRIPSIALPVHTRIFILIFTHQ